MTFKNNKNISNFKHNQLFLIDHKNTDTLQHFLPGSLPNTGSPSSYFPAPPIVWPLTGLGVSPAVMESQRVFVLPGTKKAKEKWRVIKSQIIHVWYIYLHLPYKWPSFVGKYTSTMDDLGIVIEDLGIWGISMGYAQATGWFISRKLSHQSQWMMTGATPWYRKPLLEPTELVPLWDE